ncbi:MAG TPA: hypothetical protein PKD72_06590 [Gemmatales bacterium]|nr:hypothetical protein [Gemmatales bacterium]
MARTPLIIHGKQVTVTEFDDTPGEDLASQAGIDGCVDRDRYYRCAYSTR